MKLEILGTGCPKCQQLAANVQAAVEQAGLTAEIVKVTDIVDIAARGVMMTPALLVDGEAKAVGKVPSVEELKALLT